MHIIKTKKGEFLAISDSAFSHAMYKNNLSRFAYSFIDKNGEDIWERRKRPIVKREDILYGYDIGEVTNFLVNNIKKIMPIIKRSGVRKW